MRSCMIPTDSSDTKSAPDHQLQTELGWWRISDHAVAPLSLSRISDTTSSVLHDVQVGGEISCCKSTIQPRAGDPCCIMDSHDQYQGEWAHTHIGAGTPMFEPVAAPKLQNGPLFTATCWTDGAGMARDITSYAQVQWAGISCYNLIHQAHSPTYKGARVHGLAVTHGGHLPRWLLRQTIPYKCRGHEHKHAHAASY